MVSVLVAGPEQAQVVLVRWVPGVGLAPHQEPVAVQVPVVWGLVAQVQAHEPAELPVLPVLVVVGTVLVLLLVLAAVAETDSRSVAGYKQ